MVLASLEGAVSYTWEEITSLMQQRRSEDSRTVRQMIAIRDRYNSDIAIPIASVPDEPDMAPLMPQLIHDGIEGVAMRAAGSMPNITVPCLKPSLRNAVPGSPAYADIRRRALYASWHENQLELLIRRAFRQLSGYATFAMLVTPDFKEKRAKIELRDPLTAYPELRSPEVVDTPRNVGFVYGRSADWIMAKYPNARDFVSAGPSYSHPGVTNPPQQLWDVVEWIDEDQIVVGILGPRTLDTPLVQSEQRSGSGGMQLSRFENRAGLVPIACPRRVTLDRVAGQMDSIVGIVDWMARLMALDVLAAEKDVFPDIAVLGEDNRVPELAGGEWHDGRTGNVNLLQGARGIQMLHTTPGPMTERVLGALERTGRMASGATPLYGGDNPSSLRTGRAIDTIGSFSIDPMVAELQAIMARGLERCINPAIMEIEKGYWPNKKYTVFSGQRGDREVVEYVPAEHFELTANTVAYSFPGTDISQATVTLAQMNGAGLVSKETVRMEHPLIDNPEQEQNRIVEEQLTEALLAGLQQQAAQGILPPGDMARITQLVMQGKSLPEAVEKAQREAQERQAQQAPAPQEGQVAAPEAMAGIAQPGMGAEQPQGQPPIGPPAEGLQNLRGLLTSLKG